MKHLYIKLSIAFIGLSGSINAQVVTTLAGSTTKGSADGTGTAAGFYNSTGVVSDGKGNLYVADEGNNEIRKIVISTGAVTTIAGSTTAGHADGTGTAASFNAPGGICTDGTNLYVAEDGNNEIRQIVISSGVVTTLAGSTTAGFADGTGTAAKFFSPWGITTDGSGNLYVADANTSRIRQVVISSGVVTTLAGSGTLGYADGTGTAASFGSPTGIVTDGIGNLYVSDANYNNIRKIVISSKVVTTFAGSTTGGNINGTGTAASFNQPWAITTDGIGNLYVGDRFNNEIRQIVISSAVVTTLAGSTTVGSANGTGTAASFSQPWGVTVDGSGNLYVADFGNNEIRMITLVTGVNELSTSSTALVYPNPASNTLNIQSKNHELGIRNIVIHNVLGEKMYSIIANSNQPIANSQMKIDISSLPVGLYFISMENSSGEMVTEKFMKQ